MYTRIYYDAYHNKLYCIEKENGKRNRVELSPKFEYYIYDKSGNSTIKDIYGNPVILHTSESKKDMDMVAHATNACETDIPMDVKFLQDRYKGKDLKVNIKDFQIATLDIEIQAPEFPKPEEAKYPINLISVHYSQENQVYTFGNKPYTGTNKELVQNYHYCEDEKTMIEHFIQHFRKKKPDVITGWAVRSFDIPYIVKRSEILKVSESLSPVNSYRKKHWSGYHIDESEGYDICGLSILDGLDLFKNYEREKQVSYSLQNIGMLVVGEGKKDYEGTINDAWEKDWNGFVEYNVQDVMLVKKIEDKKKYIELTVRLCYQSLIPFNRVFSTIALVEGFIIKYLHEKNLVLPDKKVHETQELPGAYVFAKTGYFKYCMSYDAESLYPHMIMQWGISPEKLQLNDNKYSKTPLSEYKVWETADGKKEYGGIYYDKTEKGVLCQVTEKVIKERKKLKKKMFIADALEKNRSLNKYDVDLIEEVKKEKESSSYYDGQQYVYKILANCFHPNTDIMTVNGIKNIKDVKTGDLVYSINKNTKNIEIKPIEHIYEYDFDGELNRIKNQKINIAVTDDHSMLELVNNNINTIKTKEFVKRCFRHIPIHNEINYNKKKKYIYLNEYINNLKDYELLIYHPEKDLRVAKRNISLFDKNVIIKQQTGRSCQQIALITNHLNNAQIKRLFEHGYIIFARSKRSKQCNVNNLRIYNEDFSKFLGYYLSEGSTYVIQEKQYPNKIKRGISKKIHISQYKHIHLENYNEIYKIISSMITWEYVGPTIYKDLKSISFSSDLYYDIIVQNFGTHKNKHIFHNSMINDLNYKLIFDYMYKGDGTTKIFQYNICKNYKELFEDYMQLCLLVGIMPRYTCYKSENMYRIHRNKSSFYVEKKSFSKEKYKGKVYNLTVKDNHTVYAGENGKFIWIGQSIFGCAANPHFHLYNFYNALTITLGGQDLIKYLSESLDTYMMKHFHNTVLKLFPNVKNYKQITKSIIVQNDTDSIYLCLDEVIQNLGITFNNNQEVYDWMDSFDKKFITPFFDKILQIYADNYKCEQLINLKREKIITQKIITAKKKYVDEILANEDKLYIDKPKISVTGIEIVRTDTPSFCRDKLKKSINKFFETHCEDKSKIIEYIKEVKDEFIKSPIKEIAIPKGVSDYNKYANNVQEYISNGLRYPDSCPIHVRASMNYNYLIEKMHLPFKPITNGTKIKYIHIASNNEIHQDIIAFINEWPKEFDKIFNVDYDRQFNRTFIAVLQRLFDVLNWGEIQLETNTLNQFIQF
jgi:DNA polymerase I